MPALTKAQRETFTKFIEDNIEFFNKKEKGYIEVMRQKLADEFDINVSSVAIYNRLKSRRRNLEQRENENVAPVVDPIIVNDPVDVVVNPIVDTQTNE